MLTAATPSLQEGSMRCDVNVSVRPRGREKFGTKVGCSSICGADAILCSRDGSSDSTQV